MSSQEGEIGESGAGQSRKPAEREKERRRDDVGRGDGGARRRVAEAGAGERGASLWIGLGSSRA